MSPFDDLLHQAAQPFSRKTFLATTAVGVAATLLPSCAQNSAGQQMHGPAAYSPPATVPKDEEKPIELEQISSEYDRKTAPTPNPLPPDERIGYALVGLGHLTLNQILPALMKSEKSRPVALVSGSPKKMARVAAQYGIDPKACFSYADYEKLAGIPACRAVYIVLPNAMHAEYTIRAARMGKHVLCEKPMATSPEEAQAMIDACQVAGVKLMIAYRIQYEPTNGHVRKQLDEGTFGKPKLIMAHNGQSTANPRHWRHIKALSGGGSLPDIGLYCLNTARYLLGEEPTEIFAYQFQPSDNSLFKEIEERVSWLMKFPSGVTVNCSTDYAIHESRHYRVLCEKGWLNMDNAFAYEGQRLETRHADGPLVRQEHIDVGAKDQFMLEIDHFSDCIRHDRRPYTPGEEGLQDQRIMAAIYESARTGMPVHLKRMEGKDLFRGDKTKPKES